MRKAVSVTDRPVVRGSRSSCDERQWDVQWHPASGARVRHVAFTGRDLRRLILALGLFIVATGVLAGFQTWRAQKVPRLESRALLAHQAELRALGFELAGQLSQTVEASGLAFGLEGLVLHPPTPDIENEELFAWLAEQSTWLAALGPERAPGRAVLGGQQADFSLQWPLSMSLAFGLGGPDSRAMLGSREAKWAH